MRKAEDYIKEHTKHCSNSYWDKNDGDSEYPWLTPDQARKAVEIAREETLQGVKSKLLNMLQTSIDTKHFFEQLDDYIEELEEAINYE